MNFQEKLRLARQLEVLGVDIIEAGFPASSPGDFDSVRAIARQAGDVQIAGLARCVRKDIERCWEAVREARHPRIHTFIATSPLHMRYKLRKSPAEVLEQAEAMVAFCASLTENVEFSMKLAGAQSISAFARIFSAKCLPNFLYAFSILVTSVRSIPIPIIIDKSRSGKSA